MAKSKIVLWALVLYVAAVFWAHAVDIGLPLWRATKLSLAGAMGSAIPVYLLSGADRRFFITPLNLLSDFAKRSSAFFAFSCPGSSWRTVR